jgi:hypothetical protein
MVTVQRFESALHRHQNHKSVTDVFGEHTIARHKGRVHQKR